VRHAFDHRSEAQPETIRSGLALNGIGKSKENRECFKKQIGTAATFEDGRECKKLEEKTLYRYEIKQIRETERSRKAKTKKGNRNVANRNLEVGDMQGGTNE